jgi:hypothetical protein
MMALESSREGRGQRLLSAGWGVMRDPDFRLQTSKLNLSSDSA